MTRHIKVTRHGFTSCPSCHAHIQVGAIPGETVCPFCAVQLSKSLAAQTHASGLQKVAHAGRSGLIAAAVLGLSAVPACVPSGTSPTGDVAADISTDTAPDMSIQPVYGEPADIPIQPPYGIPEDVIEDDAGPDEDIGPQPQPAYGVPADPDNG